MHLPRSSALKTAVDFMLCTICHIQPTYFTVLLQWVGILKQALHAATDDRKTGQVSVPDQVHCITDDFKESRSSGQSCITDDRKTEQSMADIESRAVDRCSATDDSKESAKTAGQSGLQVSPPLQTDDRKEDAQRDCDVLVHDLLDMHLTEAVLSMLAVVSQSQEALEQLLATGFPAIITQALLEFCTAEKNLPQPSQGAHFNILSFPSVCDKYN